ncbi:MAG: helix-turn-helix domain-containing protein [Lysobacter sp.]
MATTRETALALAGNLKRLMDHHELSQAQLSKKAGVGQSTLSNLLDSSSPLEINPRADTIERLADYFGIPSWQLLIPDLPLQLLMNQRLSKLIENYRDAPENGRENINRVAESEVRYAAVNAGLKKTGS